MSEVVAIVATSQRAGKIYAKTLGLKEFVVVTDPRRAQGLRVKATIVTPAYLNWVIRRQWEALQSALINFNETNQADRLGGAPQG